MIFTFNRYETKQAKKTGTACPQQNPQTPVYSTVVVTPPRREINDIGTWKSALRSADIGIRWPLYDLYASILLDGQVTDAINKRIEAITDADIHFTADGKPVKEMEDLVDSAEFERLLEDIMWSRFWGITVDEFTFIPGFDFNSIPASISVPGRRSSCAASRIRKASAMPATRWSSSGGVTTTWDCCSR